MRRADLGLGEAKTQSWWPWYAPLQGELRNWGKEALPWTKIKDGSLGRELVGMVKACYEVFRAEGKLELLK